MAVAAGLCLAASSAHAQAGVTTSEFKCESGTGKALAKFTGAKSKCVSKCLASKRKTMGPYTGCFAPFADVATFNCVMDPAKGAEAKARAAIVKGCSADCPECYAASNCSTGEPFVGTTESLIDLQGPGIYCTEDGGGTPTKDQAKCEDSTSKALVKFVGAKSKCYDKCNGAIFKGKIPEGSCNPPTPSDPATASCVLSAEGKSAAAIDKACTATTRPPCHDGTPLRPNTGAGWTALVESVIDGQIPVIACGSPSGAFID
jgi:hypothetical protein